MKKIFALILVLLMLLPVIAACKPNPDESSSSESSSTQNPESTESSSTNNPNNGQDGRGAGDGFSSKDTVLDSWSGKTLNVLVTNYSGSVGAPWSQVELGASSFGEDMQREYDERQALILEKYGVTVNWVQAQGAQAVAGDLTTAMTAQDASYEIAYPRATEVQALVALVYDMNYSEYLDFDQPYFNQAAYDSFTVYGHTLFAAGDFDFNDEQVAYMLFVNKDMLSDYGVDGDTLYAAVKDGTWTYDRLKNISKNVSQETGNGTYGDEDVYGFATKNVSRFYQYAGIFEADVDPDLGAYRIALNLDETKVATVIDNIIECKTSSWSRQGQDGSGVNGWGGSYGANATVAFNEQRVLFLDEVAQNFDHFGDITFALGVLPFPKLNTEQDRYYVPLAAEQTTFVCVPKATSDKEFSFYFVDVLAWTGGEHIMEAYYDRVEAKMDMATSEQDMEILKTYIFDNIVYDVGHLTSGWAGFLVGVRNDSHANNTNNFTQAFGNASEQAATILDGWNTGWANYYEDIE